MDIETAGSTSGLPEVAAGLLDRLSCAAPDTGDDRTQLVLDDALDLIEARLERLLAASSGDVSEGAR
ncbi:hypothetical protein [Mobilicoccus massiliensis]|uniref:hypothetical protein n=1 Tax=Mobilicoccus massiliensis TaxID=1522310 RepID=UPI00058ADD09|nr:hypothetical protein [Mobilicoccus massiliensis]